MITILLIAALHLHILWTETPANSCAHPGTIVIACFKEPDTIYLDSQDKNLKFSLSHELGHASGFDVDKAIRKVIDKYPAIRQYPLNVYPTAELREREKVADWFAFYLTNENGANYPKLFQEDYPDIYKVFTEKVNQIVK